MTGAVEPLVVLKGVGRSFDAGRIIALQDVSFRLNAGELVALAGPSGSGKSTLVNLLAGIDVPTAGTVSFGGLPNPSSSDWVNLRASQIGIVFQDFNLLPTLTAIENVEIAMFGRVTGGKARRHIATERLDQVGVRHCADRLPAELSGGERRRVSIARSLANNPSLLLADEPTSNLDSATGRGVMELLVSLHRDTAMAMLIVTHDERMMQSCPRRVFMRDGCIVNDVAAEAMVAA